LTSRTKPSVDIVRPLVKISHPTPKLGLLGIVPLTADVVENVKIARVHFSVNGEEIPGSPKLSAPWSLDWNSAGHAEGLHRVSITAYDTAGNYGRDEVEVNVITSLPIVGEIMQAIESATAVAVGSSNSVTAVEAAGSVDAGSRAARITVTEIGAGSVQAASVAPGGYSFRALFDITPLLTGRSIGGNAVSSGPLEAMLFDAVTAYQKQDGADTQLTSTLHNIYNPNNGRRAFVWLSGWRPESLGGPVGGIARLENPNPPDNVGNPLGGPAAGKLERVMNAVGAGGFAPKNHPAMNVRDPDGVVRRRYYIADDTSTDPMFSMTFAKRQVEYANMAAWGNRIRALDPNACICIGCYRTSPDRITELAACNPDEFWLDGYPNGVPAGQVVGGVPQANYDTGRIPAMVAKAEAVGIPYVGVISAHAYTNVSLPTPETFTYMMDQWKATNARGYAVYAWDAEAPFADLSDDATLRTRIGEENLENLLAPNWT